MTLPTGNTASNKHTTSDSADKAFGYVYELKISEELATYEKRINERMDRITRGQLLRIFVFDTAREFEMPMRNVTMEVLKFRGLPYLTSEFVDEDYFVKDALGRRRKSEPIEITREATMVRQRVRRNSWSPMSKLEAARPSILENKKITHREPLRDPIDPAKLGKSFRRRTWTEMSRSEAGRREDVEKRREIERRCSGIWALLPTFRSSGEEAAAMKDTVESAPITCWGLLRKAKMEIPDIFEGGQISSANIIGRADRV
ncbi:f2cfd687-be02-4db6-bde4-822b6a978367-CDS [Sclerotinia trifoliorum]|uniref:F2cfd687-be02-4db6-bde4-822b6a978367-CDS n=1 Tax=Sclerotinia trifoliorum TaxID=28548 RepID=A0A8H2ZPR2_9HELO|nr:f2cfd687-be02-4db6-bde4-822b6a978367-CDS [Sclerotinia trifoliorum]